MTPDQIDIAVIESLVMQIVLLSVFCGYIFGAATFGAVAYWSEVAVRYIRRSIFRSKQPKQSFRIKPYAVYIWCMGFFLTMLAVSLFMGWDPK